MDRLDEFAVLDREVFTDRQNYLLNLLLTLDLLLMQSRVVRAGI